MLSKQTTLSSGYWFIQWMRYPAFEQLGLTIAHCVALMSCFFTNKYVNFFKFMALSNIIGKNNEVKLKSSSADFVT